MQIKQTSNQRRQNQNKRPTYKPIPLEEHNSNFPRYHIVKFGEESRQSVNPYAILRKIKEITKKEPVTVTGNNRSSFTVKVVDKDQADKIQNIDEIEGFSCNIAPHPRFSYSKGIIYIHESDIEEIDEFKEYMREKYNIIDVQPAKFIRLGIPKQKFL